MRQYSSENLGPRHHSTPLLQQRPPKPLFTRQQTQPTQRLRPSPPLLRNTVDVNLKTNANQTAIAIESEDDFDMNQEIQKQIIQRRRRIFSHHRQYEQWRKKQFSYDSYSFKPVGGNGAAARRRMYKRQFSCMERSGGRSENSSGDSRESKYNYGNSTGGNSTKRNSVNSVSFPSS